MDIFSIFFNMKVCCVFSLESPHRGDSNGYTQYTIFNIKKEDHPKLSQICSYGFSVRRDSRTSSKQPGKRAFSVRATEGLLYITSMKIPVKAKSALILKFQLELEST